MQICLCIMQNKNKRYPRKGFSIKPTSHDFFLLSVQTAFFAAKFLKFSQVDVLVREHVCSKDLNNGCSISPNVFWIFL